MSRTASRDEGSARGAVLVVVAISAIGVMGLLQERGQPELGRSTVSRGSATAEASGTRASPGEVARAELLLRGLAVAPRSHKASYARDEFGEGWASAGGCSTRDLVLREQLVDVQPPGTSCPVVGGLLRDPYTGRPVVFRRGGVAEVDVDHLVPLRHAWQAGAWSWPREERVRFANDAANLTATSSSVNRAKGDGPLDAWLPPQRGYWCTYAVRWVQIKARWQLAVALVERDAVERVLGQCGAR